MSIQIPIRLKIAQNGAVIGYVETLNFVSGASIQKNGPAADITVSGGGGSGGDADTLQGHHASHFATQAALDAVEARVTLTEADIAAILASLDRNTVWQGILGVAIQATPPVTGATYAQWLAGSANPFAWIQTP